MDQINGPESSAKLHPLSFVEGAYRIAATLTAQLTR
jgi:hypothetical protein